MMKLTIAVATACALLSAPAFAQSQTVPSTTGAPIGKVSAADLVTGVIMADTFDVQLAQLAREKGDNSNTTFAYEEMPARTKATSDLKMLAKNGNVSIPTALDREHEQKLELLRHLSGNQFNNEFRNDEVQYDLRHTFAATGAGGGLSLPLIGRLLGHTQARTTQRP